MIHSATDPSSTSPRSTLLVRLSVQTSRMLGLLLLGAVTSCRKPAEPPIEMSPAKRVVLISIDTLRPDHLSLHGYPRPTSPRLEELANDAVVFEKAMSHAPYTLPSHMSMMTGLHPWAHGVRFGQHKLRESVVTVAEVLQSGGFATAGFTDGGLVGARYGFGQGFDVYHDEREIPRWSSLHNGFRRFGDDLHDWIRDHAADPFFVFVHTFDTHGPYMAEDAYKAALGDTRPVVPEEVANFDDPLAYLKALNAHEYLRLDEYESLDQLIDNYDATIRFVDEQVGKLIDLLKEQGIYDDTLLIVTSDHGESFLDHGIYLGHGITLYEEEVHVPLIVKFPRGEFAGTRSSDVVRLIDLYPTICKSAKLNYPDSVQGADLVDSLTGKDEEPRVAYGDSPNLAGNPNEGFEGLTSYVRRGDTKYLDPPHIKLPNLIKFHLHRPSEEVAAYDLATDPQGMAARIPTHAELYDLGKDPHERDDLSTKQSNAIDRIRDSLRGLHQECAEIFNSHQQPLTNIDDLTVEQLIKERDGVRELHGLGYISTQDLASRIRAIEAMIQAKTDAAKETSNNPPDKEDPKKDTNNE